MIPVVKQPDSEFDTWFDDFGVCVIRDALDVETRRTMLDAAYRLVHSSESLGRQRGSDGKDGFRGVVYRDSTFLPLISNQKVLPFVVASLSTNIHLLTSHLVVIPSGAPKFIRTPERHGWHTDMHAVAPDMGRDALPRLAVKVAYFLSDVSTEDAGVTRFVPSVQAGKNEIAIVPGGIDPADAETPRLGATDALMFENRVWHAGGINTSGHDRVCIFIQYGYRWLKPVDDPFRSTLDATNISDVDRQLLGASDVALDGSYDRGGGGAAIRAWLTTLGEQ